MAISELTKQAVAERVSTLQTTRARLMKDNKDLQKSIDINLEKIVWIDEVILALELDIPKPVIILEEL